MTFCEKFDVPEAALAVIDSIVSPVEQEICVRLTPLVFTIDDVRRVIEESGLSVAASFTAAAYRRGIFALESPDLYRVSNFYNRLDIFAISETTLYRSFDKTVRQNLNDWYFDAYYASLDIAPDRAPTKDEVLTIDETIARIRNEERQAYLAPCDCRSLGGEGTEENCGKPLLTCISYRSGINTFAHRGHSKPISKDRAEQIVRDADAAGLMHTANPNGICNCCADCCFLSRARVRRNLDLDSVSGTIWLSTKAIRLDTEKCIGCGTCLDRCPFKLFTMDAGTVSFNGDGRCVGCGLCVQTCPAHALILEPIGTDK